MAPLQRKDLVVGCFASLQLDEPGCRAILGYFHPKCIGRSQLAVRQTCLLTRLVRAVLTQRIQSCFCTCQNNTSLEAMNKSVIIEVWSQWKYYAHPTNDFQICPGTHLSLTMCRPATSGFTTSMKDRGVPPRC